MPNGIFNGEPQGKRTTVAFTWCTDIFEVCLIWIGWQPRRANEENGRGRCRYRVSIFAIVRFYLVIQFCNSHHLFFRFIINNSSFCVVLCDGIWSILINVLASLRRLMKNVSFFFAQRRMSWIRTFKWSLAFYGNCCYWYRYRLSDRD